MADAVVRFALVVGSAACVWDDVNDARALCKFDAICCVKRAGIEWPETFDVWAGLHPEHMKDYEARRRAKGLPGGYEIVCPPDAELGDPGKGIKGIHRRVGYRWPGMNASAGSGIYGAKVMTDAGYRAVLAGIPMNDDPHFLNHEKWGRGPWGAVTSFLEGLRFAVPHMRGRVKSMSGLTKEILGAPTPEWLAGSQS